MFLKNRQYFLYSIFSAVFIHVCSAYIRRHASDGNNIVEDVLADEISDHDNTSNSSQSKNNDKCWMRINSKKHFDVMDKLDERFAEVREQYQEAAEKDNLDQQMLDVMIKTRGAAEREIQRVAGDSGLIPAGINLGGYFMLRMPNSLLFFHRMKLRNNTHFHVTHLHNDLANMTLRSHLLLNDLHLVGSFDRSITDKNPSVLFYTPTYGQVEILLKNVQLKFEGRYRLLKDKLTIEMIISDIDFDDIMMTYLSNENNRPMRLQRKNIDGFLVRLKSDLDKWLKDYFNDYLMYFGLVGKNNNDKFQQYDKQRALELNDFSDRVINKIIRRLHQLKAESVELPSFTIFTSTSMELLLKGGVLRGLDTIYRRSVATGKKENNLRRVDAIVGFSNLKVVYEYEALLASNIPLLTGVLILSADELTARMEVTAERSSQSADIHFHFLEQTKPESLTIEGAANRMISNFKYLLEQHVIAIMSNTLLYNLRMLDSVTRCVPFIKVHQDPNNISFEDLNSNEDKPNNPPNLEENTTTKNNKPEETPDQNQDNLQDNDKQTHDPLVDSKEAANNVMLIEDDSANIELPSHGNEAKQKLHLKYTKNLTLSKID